MSGLLGCELTPATAWSPAGLIATNDSLSRLKCRVIPELAAPGTNGMCESMHFPIPPPDSHQMILMQELHIHILTGDCSDRSTCGRQHRAGTSIGSLWCSMGTRGWSASRCWTGRGPAGQFDATLSAERRRRKKVFLIRLRQFRALATHVKHT